MDTLLPPTIGKEGDVLLLYIGKSDIYCRKVEVTWQLISRFIGRPDRNLLPIYVNFFDDRYLLNNH
jgi:hypothetical protein